jgi:outer membrane immunogenic protein
VGVETDFNWSGLEGQGSSSSPIGGDACRADVNSVDAGRGCSRGISTDQEVLWFGTLRARAGWLATNNLLLYGTGGLAYGKVSESVIASNVGGPGAIKINQGGFSVVCGAGQTCYQGSSDFIGTGWTAGGGLEYHVPGTAASLKLEYLFVDLGSGGGVNAVAGTFLPKTSPSSFTANFPNAEFNTVKLGVNWKLN